MPPAIEVNKLARRSRSGSAGRRDSQRAPGVVDSGGVANPVGGYFLAAAGAAAPLLVTDFAVFLPSISA